MRSIISVELDYAWRISTAIEKSNFKRTENFRKINVEPTRSDQVCLFSWNTRTAGNLLAMYLSPSLTTALFLRISKRETRTTKRVLRNPVIALKRRDILFPRIIAYRHHSVSCVTMLVNEWATYRATQQTLLSSESSDHRFIVVPFQPIQSSLFFSLFFSFFVWCFCEPIVAKLWSRDDKTEIWLHGFYVRTPSIPFTTMLFYDSNRTLFRTSE